MVHDARAASREEQTVARKWIRLAAWSRALSFGVMWCCLAGCDGMEYVLHVADGHFGAQGAAEPIVDVLAAGRLSEEDAEQLRLAVRARTFAVEQMGLSAGASYTTFFDTSGAPLAWNLSAARQDALVPYTWAFPIVGTVPYLAFYDEGYLRRIEHQVQAQGYDTYTYELDAYSTLGLFDDPVRSPMLRRGTLSLTETIIHELLHNTIWRANDTTFNESLATFVGRQGAIEFLAVEFGEASGWPDVARQFYADSDAINGLLVDLYNALAVHYAQPLSRAEKIAGREAIYAAAREQFIQYVQPALHFPDSFAFYAALPANNAWLLGNQRYNYDLTVFAEVYASVGQNWTAALDVYRTAALAAGDPFEHLRQWLADSQAGNPGS